MTFTPQSMPDQFAPLRAAVRYGLIGLVVLTVVSVGVSVAAAGTPGLWGSLIGVAIGGGFVITTALSVALTTRFPASAVGALLLGGWLVKMVIALIVLVALKDADFYSRYALGLTILGALVVVLGAEVFGVVKTKVAYVDNAPDESRTDNR
ncbi:hypothetical protein CH275_04070 [Rhodococcus sp. 06-235-1A]|nr:hypothetical protein CH275_04070 [Rhodococcus sp. 06-235-1A]